MYRSYLLSLRQSDIENLLKQALSVTDCHRACGLKEEDVEEILADGADICDDCVREHIVGYPSRPLYRELASVLSKWMRTGHCPVLDLPNYDLLNERSNDKVREKKIESVTPVLVKLNAEWCELSGVERLGCMTSVLVTLRRRGLLDLLGLRNTAGTSQVWPPPRRVIECTFNSLHKPESKALLTVGARALSKHFHRDATHSWWGDCTGKEREKNTHSRQIMEKVLNDAHWINIHSLPFHNIVVEVRQREGYGLRWSVDGKTFRGFLEPQMVNGHEVGWVH